MLTWTPLWLTVSTKKVNGTIISNQQARGVAGQPTPGGQNYQVILVSCPYKSFMGCKAHNYWPNVTQNGKMYAKFGRNHLQNGTKNLGQFSVVRARGGNFPLPFPWLVRHCNRPIIWYWFPLTVLLHTVHEFFKLWDFVQWILFYIAFRKIKQIIKMFIFPVS